MQQQMIGRKTGFAALAALSVSACVPNGEVACPGATTEVLGACAVSCTIDDECLIDEVCDQTEHACLVGSGARPTVNALSASLNELSASVTSVPAGRPVVLKYSVADATHVSIDNGVLISSSNTTGEIWTQPLWDTTTFTLTAYGPGGRTQRSVVVTATNDQAPPTIVRFRGSPELVDPNQVSNIAWRVAGAERISIVKGDEVVHSTSHGEGSIAYIPTERSTLVLKAENAAGSTQAEVTIDVRLPAVRVENFDASPAVSFVGGQVEISWLTVGGSSITLEEDGFGVIFSSEDPGTVMQGSHGLQMQPPPGPKNAVRFVITVRDGENRVDSDELFVEIQSTGG